MFGIKSPSTTERRTWGYLKIVSRRGEEDRREKGEEERRGREARREKRIKENGSILILF